MGGILGLHLIKKPSIKTMFVPITFISPMTWELRERILLSLIFRHSKAQHGNNEIARTSFRVPSDAALTYWIKRFDDHRVRHDAIDELFGAKILRFHDFDGQQYQLISDEHNEGVPAGTPWRHSTVDP